MADNAAQSDPESAGRYGEFATDDSETYIYDRDDPSAWIQSDTVRRVEE